MPNLATATSLTIPFRVCSKLAPPRAVRLCKLDSYKLDANWTPRYVQDVQVIQVETSRLRLRPSRSRPLRNASAVYPQCSPTRCSSCVMLVDMRDTALMRTTSPPMTASIRLFLFFSLDNIVHFVSRVFMRCRAGAFLIDPHRIYLCTHA